MPEVPGVIEHTPPVWVPKPLPSIKKSLYRSDIHYENQKTTVKSCQKKLKMAIKELENVNVTRKNQATIREMMEKVSSLKEECDAEVVCLKVVSKVHSELVHARRALAEAIKQGQQTLLIRERVNWLENRLEKLLVIDKKSRLKSVEPPETIEQKEVKPEEEVHTFMTEMPPPEVKNVEETPIVRETKSARLKRQQNIETESVDSRLLLPKSADYSIHSKEKSDNEPMPSTPANFPLELFPEKMSSSSSQKPPKTSEEEIIEQPGEVGADAYWQSEHHRMKYADNIPILLNLDSSSYHGLPLPVPGTYTDELPNDNIPKLPWRPRRRDSEFEEVHKDALDKLIVRVHELHHDMHESAMLSVDPDYRRVDKSRSKQTASSLMASCNHSRNNTSCGTGGDLMRPVTGNMPKIASKMKEFVPMPLLAPPKLPTAKIDRSQLYPPPCFLYSDSVPGLTEPAIRIVNQGNLYKETKFSGQLFQKRKGSQRVATTTSSMDERRLKSWVNRENPQVSAPSSAHSSVRTPRKSGGKKLHKSIADKTEKEEVIPSWKDIKPKSGALFHSGLKWERVKEVVHTNLAADRPVERQDACRTLGQLRCGDTMVLYALKTTMVQDDDLQVQYEATKALVLLGGWDGELLDSITKFLSITTDNVKLDLLETILIGRNVSFVDHELPGFSALTHRLELMTMSDSEEVSYSASVALATLGVSRSECARGRLLEFIHLENADQTGCGTEDHAKMAAACECLVHRLACRDWAVVRRLLREVRWAPSWRHRCAAARLLVALGPRHVCAPAPDDIAKLFSFLETRLWEESMHEVRLDIAKVIIALDMFHWACERAEKKLQDTDEEIRAQGVQSIGTLGVRNERIVRALLEMAELDTSLYVRVHIIRTFASIGLPDKRILRNLKEKERLGDAVLQKEAKLALETLKPLTTSHAQKVF